MASCPERLTRLLPDDEVVQEDSRLFKTLVLRHQAVLVLNRDCPLVVDQLQVANQPAPDVLTVSVAHGAKNPASMAEIRIGFGIQHAVCGRIDRVDYGVLGMEVED